MSAPVNDINNFLERIGRRHRKALVEQRLRLFVDPRPMPVMTAGGPSVLAIAHNLKFGHNRFPEGMGEVK